MSKVGIGILIKLETMIRARRGSYNLVFDGKAYSPALDFFKPLSKSPQRRALPFGLALFKGVGQDFVSERRKRQARRHFDISALNQVKNPDLPLVVPPNLRHANRGIKRQLTG